MVFMFGTKTCRYEDEDMKRWCILFVEQALTHDHQWPNVASTTGGTQLQTFTDYKKYWKQLWEISWHS